MSVPVEFIFEDGSRLNARTRDVSASGFFVVVKKAIELGHTVRVLITFPKQVTTSRELLTLCEGTVVRSEPHGHQVGLAVSIQRYQFLSPAQRHSA
jgi:hypothetical protein